MSDSRTETTGAGSGANGSGERQRSRAAEAYESTRTRTSAAYAGVRERAARAGQRTGEQIEANPMAAMAGGFAVGALLAAVLPRSERETRLLGDVGTRINDAAREAARSAADAGRAQVEELTETAATKVGEAVIGAVTTATGATGEKA
jgi:ElaB/YqjD/DUF883 family membrane-anchored ribosome-binding protein